MSRSCKHDLWWRLCIRISQNQPDQTDWNGYVRAVPRRKALIQEACNEKASCLMPRMRHTYILYACQNAQMQSNNSCLPEILRKKAGTRCQSTHSRILQLVLTIKRGRRAEVYKVIKIGMTKKPIKFRKNALSSVLTECYKAWEMRQLLPVVLVQEPWRVASPQQIRLRNLMSGLGARILFTLRDSSMRRWQAICQADCVHSRQDLWGRRKSPATDRESGGREQQVHVEAKTIVISTV